jgi:hypothetical protein
MLQWTTITTGSRLGLLVHHTDAAREYAYEASSMGKLDVALAEAATQGWIVADMKNDWNRVFAFEDRK